MADPCVWTMCSICRDPFDATTGAWAWFETDATITPVRGLVCSGCSRDVRPLGIGLGRVDRRTVEAGEGEE